MPDIEQASGLRRPARLAPLCALLTLAWAASSNAQTSALPTVSTPENVQTAPSRSPFPLQLEVRTPFPPTAFPSEGQTHLVYEVYITNYSSTALALRGIDVLDANNSGAPPLKIFDGDELGAILKGFGDQSGAGRPMQIDAGATVVAFMWVSFDSTGRVPRRIRHRVNTTDGSVEGPAIDTHHTEMRVLSAPVRGAGWMASDGPNNDQSNHHRRGNLVVNGQMVMSRRYAIDWMRHTNGRNVAYGEPVFAVADATVASVRDGLPDNTPAPVETFRPAIPITMETAGGNAIALDLGGGQYAWYAARKHPGQAR